MQVESSATSNYLQQVTHSIQQLQHCDPADAANLVFNLALQLTNLRCRIHHTAIDIWQQADLPAAIKQTEILWLLASQKQWPAKIKQRLMHAGFCAALARLSSTAAQWPKLQAYPALLAAKLLATHAAAKPVLLMLNACYSTERNLPDWRQSAPSVLLTVSDYLAHPERSISENIGRRISQSRSEYELNLLRQLIIMSTQHSIAQPEHDIVSQLLTHSRFHQLLNTDVRQQTKHLQQAPALSQPILQLASKLNRQQQKVTELRLALNLLGRDRLPGILAEAELNFVLTLYSHPLQLIFQQFINNFATALQLLQPTFVADTCYRALAMCIFAPLWQHPQLWFYPPSNVSAICNQLFDTISSNCDTSFALLQHYQLDESFSALEQWFTIAASPGQLSPKHTAALQLAFYSSLLLLSGTKQPQASTAFTTAQQLGMLKSSEHDWLLQLAASSHCYCPLELTL